MPSLPLSLKVFHLLFPYPQLGDAIVNTLCSRCTSKQSLLCAALFGWSMFWCTGSEALSTGLCISKYSSDGIPGYIDMGLLSSVTRCEWPISCVIECDMLKVCVVNNGECVCCRNCNGPMFACRCGMHGMSYTCGLVE